MEVFVVVVVVTAAGIKKKERGVDVEEEEEDETGRNGGGWGMYFLGLSCSRAGVFFYPHSFSSFSVKTIPALEKSHHTPFYPPRRAMLLRAWCTPRFRLLHQSTRADCFY